MTSQNLVATDGTSNFGEVKFMVLNPPKSGIIAKMDDLTHPIKQFTQLDLIARRIVYAHTSKDDRIIKG